MNHIPHEQIERLTRIAYAELQKQWPELWPLEFERLNSNFRVELTASTRAACEALLTEEVPKWRAEGEQLHREDSIAIAGLQWGIEQLQRHLRKGCTVVFQDHEWWLFEGDGEGIMGAVNLLGLVQQLAKIQTEGKIL